LTEPNQFADRTASQPTQLKEPAAFPEFNSEPAFAENDPGLNSEEPAFGSELNTEPQAFSFEGNNEPALENEPELTEFGSNGTTAPAFAPLEEEQEPTGPSFNGASDFGTGNNGPLMVAPEEEAFGEIESEPESGEPTPIRSHAEDEKSTSPRITSLADRDGGFNFNGQPESVDEDPFSNDLPENPSSLSEFENGDSNSIEAEPSPLPVFEMNLANDKNSASSEAGPQPLNTPAEASPLDDSQPGEFIGIGVVTDDIPQGLQKPEVTLEKIAPETVILGEPMVYQIIVKNVGGSVARNVVVEDRIPRGSKLTGTKPQAQLDPESKKLAWNLGDLPAGEEVTIAVRVEPTAEGEIGSVSTVNFVAEIGATTKVTAPKVEFDFVGPETAEIGQSILFKYMVKNTGSADASQVLIRNLIPESLSHPAGNDLEYEIGTLKPGEEKEVKLMVMAIQLGECENVAILTATGDVEIKDSVNLKISGNRLSLSRKGPKARYLGKVASYETTVTNDSQTVARNVTVTEKVPEGMKFVSAGQGGQFDSIDRVINWVIPELPGESSQVLNVTLEATAEGDQQSSVSVSETYGKPTSLASTTTVKGYSTVSLYVQPLDQNAGIEVGETVVMKVNAQSKGTSPSTAVKLKISVPPELEIINVKGPAKFHKYGNEIEFDEIGSLPLTQAANFELKLEAKSSGDVRFKVSAESNEMKSPVSKEEVILILN
ncbi:MAG: DUF11 domain-containing protein, partial [Planctomycetaceae bacterium]|nr:DUF11 domain-containing protein [Planctomycetaceae bacterium]